MFTSEFLSNFDIYVEFLSNLFINFCIERNKKFYCFVELIHFFVLFNSIASGVQNEQHPHPGRSFFAVGFPRTTYLPDCPLGRKVNSISIFFCFFSNFNVNLHLLLIDFVLMDFQVLRYLKIAFDRKLIFSIGRSATTGKEDVVIWNNSVDHKTQFCMYPDPTYLQRCLTQLVHLGVTD